MIRSYLIKLACFMHSDNMCDYIESEIRWVSKNGERKIHWISWSSFCRGKKERGMDFRTFKEFNLATLTKQGWRVSYRMRIVYFLVAYKECIFLGATFCKQILDIIRAIY